MKAFVTYLKRQSPAPQLASDANGWLELPNGKRWNPGHQFKFTGHQVRRSLFQRISAAVRGHHGN